MKKILLPALCFALWMALMGYDIPAKGSFLPAMGRFSSPFTGIWQNVKPRFKPVDFKGKTQQAVQILFDERAIPHVYAATTTDALYAQGYLHAANRLFAMDITTRAAAGRLSELLGARTLEYDRKQRERGFEHSAIEKAKSWQQFPETKAYMDAYLQGINDYIRSLDYNDWPVEYKLLSHGPAEWNLTQSALVMTSMAISLCLSEDDLKYSIAKEQLTPEAFAFLFPDHNPKQIPIIPAERKWEFIPRAIAGNAIGAPSIRKGAKRLPDEAYLKGSNNWAVSGKKTKNGFPIVANDPHLGLTLPNIWYEMELHTPDMHVHGVTLPGLPLVILGFTDAIAWGSTNSGQDVLDWYTITWQDSTRQAYKLDGELVKATLQPEVIHVRGALDVVDTIRYTRWGPVTHTEEHRDMAMKWIGHQEANTDDLDYLIRINTAKNLGDYREAIGSFTYPAQNKVFGSIDGDIALSVAGKLPLRPNGVGEFVTAGDASQNDWQGYIPFEQSPFIINPASGYIGSANQIPTDTTYPYPMLGKRYFDDFRGRMVNTLLSEAADVTPEMMQLMQQNNYNLQAAELLPLLISAVRNHCFVSMKDTSYMHLLSHWNYENHRDSLSPVLYDIWFRRFEAATWDELDSAGVMHPEIWRMIDIVEHFPGHVYFDNQSTPDVKEQMADIACQSLAAAIDTFLTIPVDDRKNWGSYKHSTIPHLARFPNFGVDFIATSGAKNIINAMSKSNGPSWRMVAELSKPIKAWVNYPGGQSGDPADPHFKDFLKGFFDGQYYEVQLRPDASGWQPVNQFTISPE